MKKGEILKMLVAFWVASDGEYKLKEIADGAGLTVKSISGHMSNFVQKGRINRRGKRMHYLYSRSKNFDRNAILGIKSREKKIEKKKNSFWNEMSIWDAAVKRVCELREGV